MPFQAPCQQEHLCSKSTGPWEVLLPLQRRFNFYNGSCVGLGCIGLGHQHMPLLCTLQQRNSVWLSQNGCQQHMERSVGDHFARGQQPLPICCQTQSSKAAWGQRGAEARAKPSREGEKQGGGGRRWTQQQWHVLGLISSISSLPARFLSSDLCQLKCWQGLRREIAEQEAYRRVRRFKLPFPLKSIDSITTTPLHKNIFTYLWQASWSPLPPLDVGHWMKVQPNGPIPSANNLRYAARQSRACFGCEWDQKAQERPSIFFQCQRFKPLGHVGTEKWRWELGVH